MARDNERSNREDDLLRNKPLEMSLNIDLLGSCSAYMKHAASWSAFSRIDDEHFLRRAIRRYERFWLTLLHQSTDDTEIDLYPPEDIHWVWQLHMIQPADYITYCKQRFGRILQHRFYNNEFKIHNNRLKTATLWRKTFPNEPFELDKKDIESVWSVPNITRLDHLIDLATTEKHFWNRVELPHFHDSHFQLSAASRYRQLLSMKKAYDWEPRCLPSDIEFVWRCHMLHPQQYVEDIKKILNSDSSASSLFSISSFLTSGINYLECLSPQEMTSFVDFANRFWKSYYPADEMSFFAAGTVPRPLSLNFALQPPLCPTVTEVQPIVAFNSERYNCHAMESCELTFTSVCVEDMWTKQKNFKVSVKLLGMNSFKQDLIFESKGIAGQIVTQPGKKFRPPGVTDQGFLGRCKFDPKENRGIELQVFARQGFACFAKHKLMSTKVFDPLQNISLDCQMTSASNEKKGKKHQVSVKVLNCIQLITSINDFVKFHR